MRRKTIVATMLALLVINIVAFAFKVQPVEAEPGAMTRYPWSMFHHDFSHTGYTESLAPNTNQTLWKYTTGSYEDSSPAVVGGKVYVGSLDDNVYCLNALTGARIWNYTTGGYVLPCPAVVGGKVYVGSWDRKVYCLDALTGAGIWNYTTGDFVESSPAVVDSKVYVGSDDDNVYCLNALTGARIWNYTTGNSVESSPTVADGKVYVGSADDRVYCLNASTGALVWRYATGNYVISSCAVVGGKVYVGSADHMVYCLNALTGARVWNYTTGGVVISSPAVADGKVYVGSLDKNVYCLNALTGVLVWKYTTGNLVYWSNPAVADHVVFIGSQDYSLYAFGNSTITVPDDYPTIQEAINAACPGDTLYVRAGTYVENIIVNQSVSLIGENRRTTIVDGNFTGDAFYVYPGNCVDITNLTIQNAFCGIRLNNVDHCNITDNEITNNTVGMNLYNSSNLNIISLNNLKANHNTTIMIDSSHLNRISENNITNGGSGVILSSSSGNNTIYHNNFLDNYEHAHIYTPSSVNFWDNGYPSGGNYWSDYNGTDLHSGPFQNETGSDGIGDTVYTIDTKNIDNYPIIKQWGAQAHSRYSWPFFHHDLKHAGFTQSPAPNTNQTLWKYTTSKWVFSSPAVVDGRVYVGSVDGKVYCLDALTGAHIWNYTTGGAYSSPAVTDGKVYLGSVDGKVYCLDALTGAHIWNYSTGGAVYSSPAVADDRVYVGSDDNKTYCLDALTGASVWNYTTGYYVWSVPAVVDGRVYVGSDDFEIYCLNASNGIKIWNYTTGGVVRSSPAVVDGRVYVGSDDNKTYCLDALTGAHIWNYSTGGAVESSPAVADGRVYVGSDDNKTYCLDALTGASVWNYTTGDWVRSSPAVVDGRVYVGSVDCKFYCLDAYTGAHIWNYTTGYVVLSSPAVADGVVYVGSYDCAVYAFGNVTRVPEDYKTIQQAIDAASPNATIWIAPGIYNESLVINKTLTIIGLMGSSPIFRGGGSGTAITLLPGASGSIIAGIVITNWDRGILVANSAYCKIYDNIMSSINKNGITVEGSNAANNLVYSNIFQQNAIAINLTASSAQSTIYKNIITSSTIGLKLESGGNVIYANSLTQNQIGINISVSGNVIYHNNFIDNTVQISISPSASNTWDDGYPSGGNYWGGGAWVDKYKGPSQNQPGSDGVNDTGYTIDQNNIDRYPLLQPFSRHDIGITAVLTSKSIVAQDFTVYVDVRILNYGVYDETFTVTVYANTTIIGKQTVTVARRSSVTVTFAWNTAGVAKANYTISAFAEILPDETDLTDNTLTDGTVTISIPGDVTGDIWVDMQDISILIDNFMATPPNWNPNCDINGDLSIDMADISIAIHHFMQT